MSFINSWHRGPHSLAYGADRDLVRVQALLEARRNGHSRRRDHVAAGVAADAGVAGRSRRHPIDDASTYVCECGLTFKAPTSPHAVCPACGHEQLW
jgi:rRNA maturation endonuclease Nob1